MYHGPVQHRLRKDDIQSEVENMSLSSECRKRREQLGLSVEALAGLCSLKPELVAEYEVGQHEASHAMRREIFLVLQSLETLKTMVPRFRPDNAKEAMLQLDALYHGAYADHKRDPEEWRLTHEQLKLAGEAFDDNQTAQRSSATAS